MRENEKPTEGNMPPVNAGEHSQQSPEQSPELLARAGAPALPRGARAYGSAATEPPPYAAQQDGARHVRGCGVSSPEAAGRC